MEGISVPGIGSGLDINGLVTQLIAVERAPAQQQIDSQRTRVSTKISALGQLNASLDGIKTAFTALRDGSVFQQRSASSSDSAVLKVTAAPSANVGKFSVEVLSLSATQKLSSGPIASTDTAVGTGTLSLTVNGKSSVLNFNSSNNSLSAIRDAINAAPDNPGVNASIITGSDGAHLVLSARDSGLAGAVSVTASGGDGGLAALTFVAGGGSNGLSEITAAADSKALIDGITVSSGNNRISDAISGVTLDLVAAKPGVQVAVDVSTNRAGIVAAVNTLATRFNALVTTSRQLASFNANTGSAGPLLGDSTLRAVQNDISQALSSRSSGAGIESLSDLGLRFNLDGSLTLDTTALNKALDADVSSVQAVFSAESTLGQRLGNVFDRFLGSQGAIATRSTSLTASQRQLDSQQERLDLRIAATESRLRAQFSALDSLLAGLQSTSNFLSQQLAGIAANNS
ncbi:MAG: flagellar hook protein [Gammaproteobacteria bacterium HGW-Gammaproteobacteria-6]|nr:MAG: flagellar hook protein [Gammaproteobacteria bacterium HGW-Gammaproteobacteria-6]